MHFEWKRHLSLGRADGASATSETQGVSAIAVSLPPVPFVDVPEPVVLIMKSAIWPHGQRV